MIDSEEKQTIAVNSLHDISDYTSYIDQRIVKLNHLYQSLNVQKKSSKRLKSPKLVQKQKLYQTVKEPFVFKREKTPPILLSLYQTEYFKKKQRYELSLQQESRHSQKNSLFFTNYKSIDSSRNKSKSNKKDTKTMLKQYEQVKKDILSSFYVGKRSTSFNQQNQTIQNNRQKLSGQKSINLRGKLWHGRPPVKIISQIQG